MMTLNRRRDDRDRRNIGRSGVMEEKMTGSDGERMIMLLRSVVTELMIRSHGESMMLLANSIVGITTEICSVIWGITATGVAGITPSSTIGGEIRTTTMEASIVAVTI